MEEASGEARRARPRRRRGPALRRPQAARARSAGARCSRTCSTAVAGLSPRGRARRRGGRDPRGRSTSAPSRRLRGLGRGAVGVAAGRGRRARRRRRRLVLLGDQPLITPRRRSRRVVAPPAGGGRGARDLRRRARPPGPARRALLDRAGELAATAAPATCWRARASSRSISAAAPTPRTSTRRSSCGRSRPGVERLRANSGADTQVLGRCCRYTWKEPPARRLDSFLGLVGGPTAAG